MSTKTSPDMPWAVRRLATAAALGVVLGSAFPAAAQWRWKPGSGWEEPARPSLREATPPKFLPRYREKVEEAPVGTVGGAYYAAYLAYEADQFRTAARMFGRLAEMYAEKPEWVARALFMRGESLYQAGRYYEAYKAFDRMLTGHPGARNYRLAPQREFEIAVMFLHGRRRRVLGVPLLSGPRTAVQILDRIYDQDPRGPLADDVLAARADYEFRRENYEEAEFYYERLLEEHPRSPYAGQALFRLASSRFFRQHGPDYDTGLLRAARAGFERFLRTCPNAPEARRAEVYLKRVEARLAEAWLAYGRFYQKRGQEAAAMVYYRRILRELPDTPAAAEAERRLRNVAGSGAAASPAHRAQETTDEKQ